MNEAKHTPGPWIALRVPSAVRYGKDGWKIYRGVNEGLAIAQLFDKNGEPFNSGLTVEADASLIAAAPAMLKALKVCHQALSTQCSIQDKVADAAIGEAFAAIEDATRS